MRLDGRRESSNVEDRRGMSGGAKAGMEEEKAQTWKIVAV